MLQFAQIYDTANTSPSFKHPPLWIIMAGCDGSYIDLAPSDIDGDTVKCRWGTSVESGGATYDNQLWPSLSLDEDNCIVRYTGSLDKSTEGVKPIGLMIEDFDSDGNLKSSIPVQFLAQVWTPNLNSRAVGVANYPDWFRGPDHDDHHYGHNQDYHPPVKVRDKRSDQPAYCDAVPEYTENTPLDGDILDGSDGVVEFILEASSELGEITSFSYEGPLGVKCSDNVVDGRIKCTWELTEGQLEVENHGFCYTATDSFGLTTERRCINIQGRGNIPVLVTSTTTSTTTAITSTTTTTTTTSTTTTSTTTNTSTTTTSTTTTTTTTTTTMSTTSTTAVIKTTTIATFMTTTSPSTTEIITNIHEMASFLLDGNDGGVSYENAVNYGCNGQDFDPFAKNSKPVDHTDRAFLNWKNCIQCVLNMKIENIPIYSYSAEQDSCANSLENLSRSICECDRKLVTILTSSEPSNVGIDTTQCSSGGHSENFGTGSGNGSGTGSGTGGSGQDSTTETIVGTESACCQWNTFFFEMYNPASSCCASDGVYPIGTC